MDFSYIIAAEGEAATNPLGGGSGLITIGLLVVMVVVFYFVIIRPQRKQEKETNAMRNSLRVGDEVTTIGGIIGKIVSIKDPTCVIETGRDGTRIRILKSAIKSVDVPAAVTIAKPEDQPELTEAEEPSTEDHEPVINGKKEKKSKKDKK